MPLQLVYSSAHWEGNAQSQTVVSNERNNDGGYFEQGFNQSTI